MFTTKYTEFTKFYYLDTSFLFDAAHTKDSVVNMLKQGAGSNREILASNACGGWN